MTRYATLKQDTKFFDEWPNTIIIPANTIVEVEAGVSFTGTIGTSIYFLTCGSLSLNITKESAPDLLDFLTEEPTQ